MRTHLAEDITLRFIFLKESKNRNIGQDIQYTNAMEQTNDM
jgi:hypothetical protein